MTALFTTITNANYSIESISDRIEEGLKLKSELKNELISKELSILRINVRSLNGVVANEFEQKSHEVGF